MPRDPVTGRRICFYFNHAGCTAGAQCPYMHVKVRMKGSEKRKEGKKKGEIEAFCLPPGFRAHLQTLTPSLFPPLSPGGPFPHHARHVPQARCAASLFLHQPSLPASLPPSIWPLLLYFFFSGGHIQPAPPAASLLPCRCDFNPSACASSYFCSYSRAVRSSSLFPCCSWLRDVLCVHPSLRRSQLPSLPPSHPRSVLSGKRPSACAHGSWQR